MRCTAAAITGLLYEGASRDAVIVHDAEDAASFSREAKPDVKRGAL